MSSVSENIKCPYCSTSDGAMVEYNYKTQEEFIHCVYCGYHRRFYISNWEDRANEQWVPSYEIYECSHPYGAFEVRYKNGVGECGTFIEQENEQEFLDQVEQLSDEILTATISKLVDGEIVIIKVIE